MHSKKNNVDTKAQRRPDDLKTSEQELTVIAPRKTTKKGALIDEDEPLIDTTENLQLKSKKLDRLKKRQEKRAKRTAVKSETSNFLDLPTELLDEILSYLLPSDILLRLQLLNKTAQTYVRQNEAQIARSIITWRFPILTRSFHTPIPFAHLAPCEKSIVSSKDWQTRMNIHKRSYQHIEPLNPTKICTCLTCILAWNNLNLILDLAHFQSNLAQRQPIQMIERGKWPKWNADLIRHSATIVEKSLSSPLVYATLLQIHLWTITSTLMRPIRVGKKTHHPPASKRLYRITQADVDAGTDAFLARSGPPNYDFPFHRDNYYSLEAYVPNRKWEKEGQRWISGAQGVGHANDMKWMKQRFGGGGV